MCANSFAIKTLCVTYEPRLALFQIWEIVLKKSGSCVKP